MTDTPEQEASIAYLKQLAKERTAPQPPQRIVVYLESRGLGGFVLQNVVAAHMLRRFPQAHAVVAYRDKPAWRGFLTDCNPQFTAEMRAEPDSDVVLPLDWFDVGVHAPVKCPEPSWQDRELHKPDLLLMPTMLDKDAARLDGLAEAPPHLRLPPSQDGKIRTLLQRIGLTPERWFAALHMRSTPDGDPRNVDPETYVPLIRHIVEQQGGLVVRLGTPDEPALPALPGVVDLSRSADTFILQAAAAALARYMIGTDAGPVALAGAFGTPCGLTNALGFGRRVWKPDDVVLAKRITLPDGEVLGTHAAFERGLLDGETPEGARFEDNRPEDLIAVADHLLAAAPDGPGWRPAAPEPPVEPALTLTVPPQMRDRPLVRFWE